MKQIILLVLILTQFYSVAQVPSYFPTNGLQGCWTFNGNANDQSGNSYNGTVNGATLTTDRFGSSGCAYSFNGISDFISTNYTGILGNNQRAVSFWARTTSLNDMQAVSWGGNTFYPNQGTRFGCAFNVFVNGVGIDGADAAEMYCSGGNHADGQWHHYVFQMETGDWMNMVQVYMDGVLLSTVCNDFRATITPMNTINTYNVLFGKMDYLPKPAHFNGSIDEIGIWNRTLTQSEIDALKNGVNSCNAPCGSTINPLPNVSITGTTTLCVGETITLTGNGAVSYTWSTGSTTPSIPVSPSVTTIYSVTGTNINGCSNSNSVTMVVNTCTTSSAITNDTCIVSIPNVFSPNGDGTNDVLTFTACEKILSTKIYNRWGNLILIAEHPNHFWDGRTTSGEPVSDGTYFYVIQTENKNYKGFVQVVR